MSENLIFITGKVTGIYKEDGFFIFSIRVRKMKEEVFCLEKRNDYPKFKEEDGIFVKGYLCPDNSLIIPGPYIFVEESGLLTDDQKERLKKQIKEKKASLGLSEMEEFYEK